MSEPKAAVTMSLTGSVNVQDSECAKLIRAEVAAERERCLRIANGTTDPYVNDLVRSGAWISCQHAIALKIESGESEPDGA